MTACNVETNFQFFICTDPQGTDVFVRACVFVCIVKTTPVDQPQHTVPRLSLLTADVTFKDARAAPTSEAWCGPERRRVQRDHVQQIPAGCSDAVMRAAGRV